MPELPEIEIIRRGLSEHLTHTWGFKVVFFNSFAKPFQQFDGTPNLIRSIPQSGRLMAIKRKGKYLFFEWEKQVIAAHLGMTGQLIIDKLGPEKEGDYPYDNPHVHLILGFKYHITSQQGFLVYRDSRKFGWWGPAKHPRLDKLGIDALDEATTLPKVFTEVDSKKVVYNLLMDQSFVAGLGNICVCEVLFRAKIHPLRLWGELSSIERSAIGYYVGEVIQDAIDHGGSSISDFVDHEGKQGSFQEHHAVYGKKGKNCQVDGCVGLIEKVSYSGRSVFYCPICQPRVPIQLLLKAEV